jgi:hypothetical protein
VALCPACFNPPAGCECEPRFAEAEPPATRGGATPTIHPSRVDVGWVNDHVRHDRRTLTLRLLTTLEEFGCWAELPAAKRKDYVNIKPPRSHGEARVCSFTLSTGRVEFQDGTYSLARSLALGDHFDLVPIGDKAGISVASQPDVDAAISLAKAFMASRRGMA